MARKRSKPTGYAIDAGVGVDLAPNKHGWGAERVPAVAVMWHPIQGQTMFGPFLDVDAAETWIRKEGYSAALEYYGGFEDAKWFTASVVVPTHPIS